ncbi:hypothetical protein [Microbacterium maritypicum]|uniref:hypothetical protein n=1 Tax=Microbacterium maritypicum TaxID=33918 RepID=UPI00383061BC
MTGYDELQALTISIGEHSLTAIGREKLRALEVQLDPRTNHATMTIVLRANDDESQTDALRELFDVEHLFADEVVLSYVFAETLDNEKSSTVTMPQFSYA